MNELAPTDRCHHCGGFSTSGGFYHYQGCPLLVKPWYEPPDPVPSTSAPSNITINVSWDMRICARCGHTRFYHIATPEGWEPCVFGGDVMDGETCECDGFMEQITNPLALEYIGVAFLLWRKERGDKKHLGRCLKALTDSFQEVAES